MSRVKTGPASHKRHRNIIKRAKGYFGRRKNTFRIANQAVEKAAQYAYRDRRAKKRTFRRLWITRISAASKLCGTSYSQLIHGLDLANIAIDRKMLADIAVRDIKSFEVLVKQAIDAVKKSA